MATRKSTKAASAGGVRTWKREQGWDRLGTEGEAALEAYCRDYVDYLSRAKTERLAHDLALEAARQAGFVDLEQLAREGKPLKPGDRVYRSCWGKTLFVAQIGRAPLEGGLNLVGSHIDSPRLDAKPCPLYEDDSLVLLDTHYYGGIKKYQWVTLPLALHGVVYRRDGSKVELHLGDEPGDPVFMITDLLPHLGADQSTKPLGQAFKGDDLNVLLASRPVPASDAEDKDFKERTRLNVLRLLRDRYGIEEEDFASAELEVVPAGPARELGLDRSMVVGYGQDDRVCAYAALRAVIDEHDVPERTRAAVICDKEEIGSYGQTGMDSTFMENTVAELVALQDPQAGSLAVRRCLERSKMISGDVCALHDPQFGEVSSPHNMAKLNCGIALCKYTGARGKSGSSDASAEFVSQVRCCLNDAGVVWQMTELGKVDVGGGGTIAHYLARYGMSVIDCGVGLFNMHAPYEIAGKLDIYMGYRAYRAFLDID